jgi:RNA polymerase sigma-70 factor (ECF subfamily)
MPVSTGPDEAELERSLLTLCEQAESRFPGASLARQSFMRWLGERCSRDELSRIRADDLWLACASASGDAVAVRTLMSSYIAPLADTLGRAGIPSRAGGSNTAAPDRSVVAAPPAQPMISSYRGQGDPGWLRVIALRSARRQRGRDARLGAASRGAGRLRPRRRRLAYLKQKYTREYKAAIEAARNLAQRDRNLLRFSLVDQLSIDQLGAIYHQHRSTVARNLQRIRRELVEQTRKNLETRLGVARAELDSIAKLVESQLDLTLPRLLAKKP